VAGESDGRLVVVSADARDQVRPTFGKHYLLTPEACVRQKSPQVLGAGGLITRRIDRIEADELCGQIHGTDCHLCSLAIPRRPARLPQRMACGPPVDGEGTTALAENPVARSQSIESYAKNSDVSDELCKFAFVVTARAQGVE
jgi:hypothetical protein